MSASSHIYVPPPVPSHNPPADQPVVQNLPTPFAAPTLKTLMIDPNAILGTRFAGPVLSGNPLISPVAGICQLTKRLRILGGYGTFSLPLVFPAGTILTRYFTQIATSFNGTLPKINLGITANGTEIASIDPSVAATQTDTLITLVLAKPWTVYVSVAGTGITSGAVNLLLFYSVPALELIG